MQLRHYRVTTRVKHGFNRSISLILRIDNLLAGIYTSRLMVYEGYRLPFLWLPSAAICRLSLLIIKPAIRWPESSGMGGRNQSEWVAGFVRNQWPDCSGIRNPPTIDSVLIGPSSGGSMSRDVGQSFSRKTLDWKRAYGLASEALPEETERNR